MNVAPRLPRSAVDGGARLLTAAALAVDAVVHLQLAPNYQLAAPAGIGEGNLFRIESAVALIVAALVLSYGTRAVYAAAFLVAAGGAAAAVLYRYVDLPAVGPIPAMYEPVWFGKKALVTAAEALGALTAALGWATATATNGRHRTRRATAAGAVSPTA